MVIVRRPIARCSPDYSITPLPDYPITRLLDYSITKFSYLLSARDHLVAGVGRLVVCVSRHFTTVHDVGRLVDIDRDFLNRPSRHPVDSRHVVARFLVGRNGRAVAVDGARTGEGGAPRPVSKSGLGAEQPTDSGVAPTVVKCRRWRWDVPVTLPSALAGRSVVLEVRPPGGHEQLAVGADGDRADVLARRRAPDPWSTTSPLCT